MIRRPPDRRPAPRPAPRLAPRPAPRPPDRPAPRPTPPRPAPAQAPRPPAHHSAQPARKAQEERKNPPHLAPRRPAPAHHQAAKHTDQGRPKRDAGRPPVHHPTGHQAAGRVTFHPIPAPHKGTIRAHPPAPAHGRPTTRPHQKPKVKKGKRTPGAEHHGPAAGYQQVLEESALTSEQTANIITCLTACHQEGADELATMALMCLGFGENSWHTYGCNSSDHCGVFQLDASWQAMHPYTDVGYWAVYALRQGFYGKGGIITIARDHPDWPPGWVTNWCQGAYSTPGGGGDYYDQFQPEARWAIRTYGKRAGLRLSAAQIGAGPGSNAGNVSNALGAGNPVKVIKSADWAGDVDNAYKYVIGGADMAVTMARRTRDHIDKLAVIGWERKHK